MSSFLRNAGLILFSFLVAAHLGKMMMPEFNTIWDPILTKQNNQLILAGSAILLALALLSSIFKPLQKFTSVNRCQRCNKRIPRGDIYCADHLKQVVHEYRDHNR